MDQHQADLRSSSTMDPLSLEDVLRDKYCINCENKSFIPSNELSQILTDPAIRHILHQKLQCDDDDLERLIAQILNDDIGNGHKKIFAILVIIGKVKYIKDFIHASVRDADLPLDLEYLRGRLANCKIHYLEAFYERQWLVIVPVLNFTVDIVPPKYSAREILPILEKKRIGGGAHGILWKVQIHPGHIRGNKSQDSHFALKQVDDRSQWEDELNALRHFSGQHAGHDHLIQLLLAYEHEDIGFFLVFPFAEGNLKQYWESNISRYPTFGHAYWLVEQCLGLAAALRKVHRHDSWPGDDRGRHGDIKPENVLWFKGSGVDHGRLVIADFSLTRFHRNDTVENTVPGERGFSSAYRPPEVDAQPRIQAAQRFDVWSLGCLFLEFIAWYLVGYSATRGRGDIVDHFGEGYKSFMHARLMDDDRSRDGIDQDKFFNITDRRAGLARVKLSVTAWMIFLHRSKNCSEAIHAILNLIENGMLLPEPTARFEMARVAIDLTEILKKCERKDYCLRGVPHLEGRGYVDLPFFPREVQLIDNGRWPQYEPVAKPDNDYELMEIRFDNAATSQHSIHNRSPGNRMASDEESCPIEEPEQDERVSPLIQSTILSHFKKGRHNILQRLQRKWRKH